MTYLLYLITSIVLVIIQTTDLSVFLIFDRFYDLLIPIILFLALFRSLAEGIPVVFIAGFMMDSFTGGPFGIYITIYFWLYVGVRWIIQYFHSGSIVLIPIMLASGVLVENLALLGAVAMAEPDWKVSATDVNNVVVQVFLVVCTGPFYMMFMNFFHKKWDKWISKFISGRSEFG